MDIIQNLRYVIVRSREDRVWCGYLLDREGSNVCVTRCRQMLNWRPLKGYSLTDCGSSGVDVAQSDFSALNDKVMIFNAAEIISVTDEAVDTFERVGVVQL